MMDSFLDEIKDSYRNGQKAKNISDQLDELKGSLTPVPSKERAEAYEFDVRVKMFKLKAIPQPTGLVQKIAYQIGMIASK